MGCRPAAAGSSHSNGTRDEYAKVKRPVVFQKANGDGVENGSGRLIRDSWLLPKTEPNESYMRKIAWYYYRMEPAGGR